MTDEGYRGCAPLVGRAWRGVLDAKRARVFRDVLSPAADATGGVVDGIGIGG